MNIKDYIHYYIGQRCLNTFFAPGHEMYNVGWILTGFDTESVHPFRLTDIEGERYTCTDSVKPQLRRLSDMTEEEALHIGKLAFFDRDMKYPDSDYTVKKTGITIELPSAYAVSINNDWYEREIRIGFNTGNIWNRPDQHIYERIYNQPQIFHYLLKQGFDLFGLIDAGLAIDAKTIQTTSK